MKNNSNSTILAVIVAALWVASTVAAFAAGRWRDADAREFAAAVAEEEIVGRPLTIVGHADGGGGPPSRVWFLRRAGGGIDVVVFREPIPQPPGGGEVKIVGKLADAMPLPPRPDGGDEAGWLRVFVNCQRAN